MWLSYVEYHLRPLPGFSRIQPWLDAATLRAWERTHQPPPPRSVKAAAIRRHAGAARRVFVESGTFFGDMVAAVRPDFDRLFSIELSPRLARRAQRRFAADRAVTILPGDSAALLGPLLRSVGAPAVLWLDGHYSGWLTARGETDTPVRREIEAVLDWGPRTTCSSSTMPVSSASPGLPVGRGPRALVRLTARAGGFGSRTTW